MKFERCLGGMHHEGVKSIDTITQAINIGGQKVVSAVSSAFAQAEKGGNAKAVAKAISTALTASKPGSATASAITSVLSTAIADGGCIAVANALSEAVAIADGEGKGDVFSDALSESTSVQSCLRGIKGKLRNLDTTNIGEAISIAIAGANLATIATIAEDTFAVNNPEEFVQGVAGAIEEGVPCTAVRSALKTSSKKAQDAGIGDTFKSLVYNYTSVSDCLRTEFQQCKGNVDSSCCTNFPKRCACTGRRCRATRNKIETIKFFNLYVYRLRRGKQCKC
eukprot:TRINITY_DN35904_c0_g2_i2.p1 TRINITY_DN35904_c0_g2~~TRINITY_DN35904_c0_g2_i2.p1  ORF type:complete len:280 (-),score=38.64 TRINITY_DN35904_c0_g2_i2:305-1144(-)